MRTRSIVTAVVLAAALALGGCSSSGDSADASEVAGAVGFTATGSFGEKPEISFAQEDAPSDLEVAVLSEGDGPVVESGDFVVADYLGQIWGTDTVFDNSYDRGMAASFPLDNLIEGWKTGLTGQHVGSRVALTVPADLGYGPSGGSADGTIGAEDTIVFVVDLVDAIAPNTAAQADATPTDVQVPVTIDGALDAPITNVTVEADATEPTDLVTEVLAEGTGEAVPDGSAPIIQYTLTTWDNSSSETTWPELGGVGMMSIPTYEGSAFAGLVGVPVGSRVLIEIPADMLGAEVGLAVVADVVGVVGA